MEKIKDNDNLVRYLILGISTIVIVLFFARFCSSPRNLSVTFDGYLSSSTVIVEKDGTIKEPVAPTRAGYIFKGWYLNGKPFDFNTKITKNIVLEAVWEKEEEKDYYIVTFVTGDSSFTREVPKNSLVDKPICNSLESNTCKGWYLGDSLFDFSTPITSDIVLEARYDINGDNTDAKPNSNNENNSNYNNSSNNETKDKEAPKSFTPSLLVSTNRVVVNGSTTDNKTSSDKLVYKYSLDGSNYQDSNTFEGLSNNKQYTVYVKVIDEAGNSVVVKRTFTTDEIGSPALKNVSNTNPTRDNVVIEVEENYYDMYYSLDNGSTWNKVDGPITVTNNTNVLVKATDGVSNSEILTIPVNNIDREAPNSFEPTINKTSRSITVTGSTTDNGGGTVTYVYKLNDGEYGINNSFDGLTTGTYTVTVKVSDELGNEREIVKTVEILPPATPEVSISNTNMTNQNVSVTVTNSSGYTVECLEGNSYVTCDNSKVFSENGSVTFRFTDGINTGESKEVVINNIDKVAPEAFSITVSDKTTRSLTVNGSTTDNVTTHLTYLYSVDDGDYSEGNALDRITTGNHRINCKALDEAGNETIASVDVTMDAVPSVSIYPDITNVTNADVTVTVMNSTTFAGEYSLDNGEYQSINNNAITIERNALLKVRLTDGFNTSEVTELDITNIDKEAPVINSLGITHTTRQIFFNVDATDDRNGTLTYQYQKNNEGYRVSSDFGYLTTGTYTMSVKVIDEAGNETIASEEVILEPLHIPDLIRNHTTWTNELIVFTLTDEEKTYKSSNNLTLQFSLDGGSYGTSGSSYQMTNGTVKFRFTDGTNIGEEITYVIDYYDITSPENLSVSYNNTTNSITVTASATDDKTEVIYKYKLDNGSLQDSNVLTGVTTGNHYVTTYAYDLAGNAVNVREQVTVDPVPAPVIEASTTALTNQNVVLTCTNKDGFTLEYSTDGTNYETVNGALEVEENNTYKFRLYDGTNYSSINNFVVNNIDKEAPEFTERNYSTTSKSIIMNYVAIDNRSTNLAYQYRIGNSVYDSSNVIDNLHTGTYNVTVNVMDEAGNSTEEVVSIEVEPITPPTYAISPDVNTKEDVTVSITNRVTSQGEFTVQIKDNNNFVDTTDSIVVTENKTLEVRFTDGINYSEVTSIVISNIDKIPPYEFDPELVLTTSTITVNASTTDNMSTVITYQYKLDDGDYQDSNEFTSLALGNHTVYVKATDEVGNDRVVSKDVELIYIPLPEVSYQNYNNGEWINTKEVATVTNKDVYTVEYKLDDGTYTSIEGDTFDIEENAYLYVRLSNGTHYSDTYSFNIRYIDRVLPYINELTISSKTSYSLTVDVDGGDDLSGIAWYEYLLNGIGTPFSTSSYTISDLSPDTEYTITVTARDRAGNEFTSTITDRTLEATHLYSIYTQNAESDSSIDFNQTSSNLNGRGVYKNSEDIYYYRGEVDNYVLLGNYCFNIVRSAENNGTKVIYAGMANNGRCTATGANATLGLTTYSSQATPFVNDVNYLTNNISYSFMDLSSQSTSIRYASNYTYENGTYTLVNPISSSSWESDPNYNYEVLGNSYKYTCFNNDSCTTLYFIVGAQYDDGAYYIELSNGKTVESYKNEMFNGTINSNVKTVLDNWYQANMTAYSSLIQDTNFCNNKTLNNWGFLNENANNHINNEIVFNPGKALTYSCPTNDIYSVYNGKLTYPVGLITREEFIYAGGNDDTSANTDSYLNLGVREYTMTPMVAGFDGRAYASVYSFGYNLYVADVEESLYIRPVITLNSDTLVTRGDGSRNNPYVIYTE